MKRLEGKNRIRRFRQIAKALTSKIIAYKGVAGVVYIGGLVRGFADRHSDVDIIVLLNEKNEDLREKIKKIGSDTQKCSCVDIDLEIHSIEDFRRREWGEIDKWDFSRAEIVFDADGETLKLLREKTRVSESFWTKRIVVCGEYLKWYCCPPKEDIGTMVELWIERGDLASAHYCLNYALDLLIRMIFALNRVLARTEMENLLLTSTGMVAQGLRKASARSHDNSELVDRLLESEIASVKNHVA